MQTTVVVVEEHVARFESEPQLMRPREPTERVVRAVPSLGAREREAKRREREVGRADEKAPRFVDDERCAHRTFEVALTTMEGDGRPADQIGSVRIRRLEAAKHGECIREQVLAPLVGDADRLEELIPRWLLEKRLIGVQIDAGVGVPELIGIRVRRVVRAQILDATEMRRNDREPGADEGVDKFLGARFGQRCISAPRADDHGASLRDPHERGLHCLRCGFLFFDLQVLDGRERDRSFDAVDPVRMLAHPTERVAASSIVVRPTNDQRAVFDGCLLHREIVGDCRRINEPFARRRMAIEVAVVTEPAEVKVAREVAIDDAEMAIVDPHVRCLRGRGGRLHEAERFITFAPMSRLEPDTNDATAGSLDLDLDGRHTLDPSDWEAFRRDAHAMLDDAIDHLRGLREGPVWRPMPPDVRASFDEPLPIEPRPLAEVHEAFRTRILPYGSGNAHPRFLGWVQGGGTPVGMMAELLAGALDANLGGRDHAPIAVERQIVRWMRALFEFPSTASGILVTGTSLANWMAVVIAKTHALGRATRAAGLTASEHGLTAYTSAASHQCVTRAMELAGLGADALVRLPVGADQRLDPRALRAAIAADRARGRRPFLVVATAGTVDTGAVDDLEAIADVAQGEGLWLHVDGAFGAFCALAPSLRPLVAGISRADSIAFDFHKWPQVPYDAGMLLVRDAELHAAAFAGDAAYLTRTSRGLAAGAPWPTDFGPDLSRGFRALKVWFTLKTYGLRRLGEVIATTTALARHLEARVRREPELELLAPVTLNIVCFRFRHADADQVNAEIVVDLQEEGIAAPSTTRIGGVLAIRVAIVNHRCRASDLDLVVDEVIRRGRARRHLS